MKPLISYRENYVTPEEQYANELFDEYQKKK